MNKLKRFRPVLAGFLLCVAALVWDLYKRHRVTPPEKVSTINAFLDWHPENANYYLLQSGGHQFIEILGDEGRILASGRAAYVFDDTGHLADWCVDPGDDPAFQKHWQTGPTPFSVTRDQAVASVTTR